MNSVGPEPKIKVGISSCLLGEKVRWNGDHRQDRYVKEILGRYFEWVPTCPEVEIGMGVPRETVRLRGPRDAPRMVGTRSGTDWTDPMRRYARGRAEELARMDLSGYIFKSKSPSCGMERVELEAEPGNTRKIGQGLFAQAVMQRVPQVPVEEEGRLNDPRIRENFIVRVFGCHRLRQMLQARFGRGKWVEFHAAHKLLLLAHSRKHYQALGRLVADIKRLSPGEFQARYAEGFMQALAVKTTVKKNVDVLHHLLGFLKEHLGRAEKQDILETLRDYHQGLVPLVVPVTLLRHHVRKHRIDYLENQVYLNPHPKELMLRNHV